MKRTLTINCPGCGKHIAVPDVSKAKDGWLLPSQWCSSCGGTAPNA